MTDKTATEWLNRWVENGYLKPQSEYWAEQMRSSTDGWYAKALKKDGKESAEAQLEEWMRGHRFRAFAASVEPIGQAMLALSKIKDVADNSMVFQPTSESYYPSSFSFTCEQVVVIDNPSPGGCGCVEQPDHIWEFYPGSVLGISHFGLQAREFGAQLGLIFARASQAQSQSNKAEYKIITIDTRGDVRGQYYTAELRHNSLLYCNLQKIPMNYLVARSSGSGGNLDEHFGIPRLEDYLASALPRLADYLTGVAKKLTSAEAGHQH